jgi:plastocyanin
MIELDQRVVAALQEIVGRAPVNAEVWPDAESYVAKHVRRRHVAAGAIVAVVVIGVGLGSAGLIHESGSTPPVGSYPTPTTGIGSVLPPTGPIEGSFTVVSGGGNGGLTYLPSSFTVTTGIYAVTLADGGPTQHTLRFDDASTLSSGLSVNSSGETNTTRVFFGRPGDYTFFCAIPGHREAGMQGVVHVTGAPVTLARAEAAGASQSP